MHEADIYGNHSRSGSGDFMMGMLWGTAIGAAVGLLLAPRAGAELRSQIADSAERFGRKAADTYGRASDTMNDLITRGRAAAREGKEKFDEARASYARGTMVDEQTGI